MKNENVEMSELVDVDGKIVITEDMPEDLKIAINYLNKNNIGLFDKIEDDDDVDIEDALDNGSIDVDSLPDSEIDDDLDDGEDDLDDSSDSSSDLNDLNNLF